MTAADVLYPSATPAAIATEAPASIAASDEPTPAAESAQALAAIMYPKMYDESLRPALADLADYGATPEELEELRSELSQLFHAVGVSPPEASKLLGFLVKAHQEPASPEQRETWAVETRRGLRHRFGPDAAARLKHAASVVARSPALKQALNESGLGNRLDVVEMFVDRTSR